MFFIQLISQLLTWKEKGYDIILVGDFNENVYSGRIARRLADDDLNLEEQCMKRTGTPLPPSHTSGTTPVCAVYATAGVEVVNVFVLEHHGGVGDHRLIVVDFSSVSVIGMDFPNIVRPEARNLHCNSERIRDNYNKILDQLCHRHRMYERMKEIYDMAGVVSASEFQVLINKWDTDLEQYMKAAEKRCRKILSNRIPWSPIVGMWLKRRRLLLRVKRYLEDETSIPDPRNLIRDCRKINLCDPNKADLHMILVDLHTCNKKLLDLSKTASEIRRTHLKDCAKRAEAKGDKAKAKSILQVLLREEQRKTWKRIKNSTSRSRGRQVTSVRVRTDEGESKYETEDEVYLHTSEHLENRFRLALSAPCSSGKLFDDVGFLGDTDAAQQILEGTYVFPPDTEKFTKLLLEETARTYAEMSTEEVNTHVTVEDYQYYWQRANERISSSYSGLHFGHYKAASFHPRLSALHAAKLSACAKTGVSLARWGIGVNVLLEKIMGNNFVHKLRAICLLEADFNWWNKLIFAKRMMSSAGTRGFVPGESFAKTGSSCEKAVLTKIFIVDESRVRHYPMCIGENDFGDCYDRVSHLPAAMALRGWGVPKEAVKVLLQTMQRMQYYLRTGYGESKHSYGGKQDDPFMGYGQGNGAAPPGFSAVSSLIVNAYRRLGHGAQITTSLVRRLVQLCAVMYVDDTDLLHWAGSPTTTTRELILEVQRATNEWGLLVQATGGALKPIKCSIYLITYRFVHGRARMNQNTHLPLPGSYIPQDEGPSAPSHITIPQPNGTQVPIPTRDVTVASEMLGIFFAPLGKGTEHIKAMCKKGFQWADRLSSRPLRVSDAWVSFNCQLLPGMAWGLVTVVLDPVALSDEIRKVYYKILPFLGVRRNIDLPWRLIPVRFQGLGLPNFVVWALAAKLHAVVCHWGFLADECSSAMMMNYESLVVETGLYGNIFSHSYKTFGILATDGTWWKNLWQLLDYAGVELVISEDYHLGPIREDDRSLTELFVELGFVGTRLDSLNVARKFYCVTHVSDIVLCDGKTIRPEIMSRVVGDSSYYEYPMEVPRESDFTLWEAVLRSICIGNSLRYPVGSFIRDSALVMEWRCSSDENTLYRINRCNSGWYDIFVRVEEERVTRTGPRFEWLMTHQGVLPSTCYASVKAVDGMSVRLHSSASVAPAKVTPQTFLESLQSFDNQSLFKHFRCDGDGEWIEQAVLRGSLVVVHDGSYKKELDAKVCGAATVLYCTVTKKRCSACVVERSEAADNYRAEILGGIITQLILNAACRDESKDYPAVSVDCDNKGVVFHGNAPGRVLKEKQAQSDVLRVMKGIISSQRFQTIFLWVPSHADDHKSWSQCTLKERINIKVDELAKLAIDAGIASGQYIDSVFPFELVWVMISSHKTTGSLRTAITNHWGEMEARRFYDKQDIVAAEDFDLIWWDGCEALPYPRTYKTWLTKQVSGICGTNDQLRYFRKVENKCPNCGWSPETSKHMTRCQDNGRVLLFQQGVAKIKKHFSLIPAASTLSDMFGEYLLCQGSKLMADCCPRGCTILRDYAEIHDKLGWDSLMEGRISHRLIEVLSPLIVSSRVRSVKKWARELVKLLVDMTHEQWLYRNSKVHQKIDGLTEWEHEELYSKVARLMETRLESLLPCYRHLLSDMNFRKLGEGRASSRQMWVTRMEAAIVSSRVISSGVGVRGCTRRFYVQRGCSASPVCRDKSIPTGQRCEGSVAWQTKTNDLHRYRQMSLSESFGTDRLARRSDSGAVRRVGARRERLGGGVLV